MRIPDVQIRSALAEDADAIATIHVTSWRLAYSDILETEYLAQLSVSKRAAMWLDSIKRDEPKVLVAEIDSVIVGFIAIGPSRDKLAPQTTAEVWALYLEPSVWSTGVGKRLWLAAREYMLAQNVNSIALWVMAGNRRAIRFYRTAGFIHDTLSSKELQLGGVKVQEHRYVCELQRGSIQPD